jgi:hypothetical protein
LRGGDFIPLIKEVKNIIFEKIPHLPRNCPFEPMKYVIKNVTLASREFAMGRRIFKALGPGLLPNGIYRISARGYNNDDLVGVYWYMVVEINIRMNEDKF